MGRGSLAKDSKLPPNKIHEIVSEGNMSSRAVIGSAP